MGPYWACSSFMCLVKIPPPTPFHDTISHSVSRTIASQRPIWDWGNVAVDLDMADIQPDSIDEVRQRDISIARSNGMVLQRFEDNGAF